MTSDSTIPIIADEEFTEASFWIPSISAGLYKEVSSYELESVTNYLKKELDM
jgi:hypothetical protein